jgi:hypothetical protein
MIDSDDKIKIREIAKGVVHKEIDDSGIREAAARTRWLRQLVYTVISVVVLSAVAGAGFAVTISKTVSSQGTKLEANDQRIEAVEKCVAVIQDSAIDMARSVGQIEGMLLSVPNER